MSVTPTFSGEVQMRRYSDTSSQGVQITFALPDRDALEPLIPKVGKRFMAVLVEIGDDELPVEPPQRKDQRGPLCREACDYCEMQEFQEWVPFVTHSTQGDRFSAERCKTFILKYCDVLSRKDLDANATAGRNFVNGIRVPFMRYMQAKK